MGENTAIEWADDTANFWEGCTQISPACDRCYAMKRAERYGTVAWNGPPRKVAAGIKTIRHANQRAQAEGRKRVVFINSLSDVMDKLADPAWRDELFHECRRAPHVIPLMLTKRIGNAADMIEDAGGWPPNAWLGATFCNQAEVDRDMGKLCAAKSLGGIPIFASIEPLLGPVSLRGWLGPGYLDWVIVGGESGDKEARPMHPDWPRRIRDECASARVPFLFKQWGEWAPRRSRDIPVAKLMNVVAGEEPGIPWVEAMERVGKKAAGRWLDGAEHTEFPPGFGKEAAHGKA